MKSKIIIVACLIVGTIIAFALHAYLRPKVISHVSVTSDKNVPPSPPSSETSSKSQDKMQTPPSSSSNLSTSFIENFDSAYTVKEVGNMSQSTSSDWWVSAGGYLNSANGIGSTVSGKLPATDSLRIAYSVSNPRDTDDGYHPQNIFRLVLIQRKWQNFNQEGYFKIIKNNLSDSSYRNASNGLFFFNRYQDEDNLYYTGIRVDGSIVIKKKIGGKYFTMVLKKIFSGTYDRKKKPNLLPQNSWIGFRTDINDESDGSVSIKVFLDYNRSGNWQLVTQTSDYGTRFGGKAFKNEGYGGIRTDFMDVEFSNYKIEETQ